MADIGVTPMALEGGYRNVYVWELHHFEPVANRSIGIWPHNSRFTNLQKFQELTNKYGFKYLLFADAHGSELYNIAINNGFSNDRIVAQVFPNSFATKLATYGGIKAYYVDEPVYNSYDFIGMRLYFNAYCIAQGLTNTQFYMGDFDRTSLFNTYSNYADQVFYTSYDNRVEILPGVWVTESDDQRPSWTDMRNRYGTKFNNTWVSANEDAEEFYSLLGHASNKNINTVWYFQLEDNSDLTSNHNISEFCESAWYNGYLRKFDEKIKIEYKCNQHFGQNTLNCSASNPECIWIVNRRIPQGIIREVSPIN